MLVAVDKTDELHEPRLLQPQPFPDDDYTTRLISEWDQWVSNKAGGLEQKLYIHIQQLNMYTL